MSKVVKLTPLKIHRKSLLFLAFLEGALVIFCELIGAKMLNSFFGASLFVWTGIITTTLAFLTLGYFIGGKLSTKINAQAILRNCFALASFFIIIMPYSSDMLFLKYSDSSLIVGAVLTSIFLIGPSVLLLGISSPIIIQLLTVENENPGKVAGQVYAISTIAGILSTLILGFFLLPYFGLKIPLLIAALTLIVMSLYIKINFVNGAMLFLVLTLGLKVTFSTKDDPKYFTTLYKSEGLMGQLKVMDQIYKGYDAHYRLLFINGVPQTIISYKKNVGSSFWEYVHRISATASLKQNKKALLIGMGGGGIANELQKQNIQLDIVDIDQRMDEIAQKYFQHKPKESTTFTIDDARHYIKTSTKKYDLIVLDICSGEVQPYNVFTLEGIAELKKIIRPDGIILIQYQEKINPRKTSGSQSIAKTFIQNNFKVYQNIEKADIASVILACSPNEIDFGAIEKSQLTKNVLEQKWLDEFLKEPFTPIKKASSNSVLLTDDRPVLEFINTETIELWRKSMMQNYGVKFLNVKK